MTYLGSRKATGFVDAQNPRGANLFTVRFEPDELPVDDFEVYHIVLTGPGGNFDVYLDDILYSTAARGDRNEYDPNKNMFVRKGQRISFYWSLGTGTAPIVILFCKTPEVT